MKKQTENILRFLLILSLPLFLYLNSIAATTLWEDEPLILDNRLIRDAGNLIQIFRPSFWSSYHIASLRDYRPVSFSTFIIDNMLFGGSAKIYRAGNIFLYIVICLFLYIFVRLLSSSTRIALAAALLFAALPVHVEAVVWIKNRAELLSSLFMLASLTAFTKMCLSARWRPTLFIASLLAYTLALLSKESAIVFPLVLWATLFFLRGEGRTGIKAAVLVPHLILSGAFYLFTKLTIPHQRMWDALSYLPSPHSRAAIAVKTIGSYLKLLLLPTGLSIQHVSPSIGQAMDWAFLLYLSTLFIFSLALIVSLRRNRLLALALAWFALCLLPVANIIIMIPGRPVAEQRLFFPSAGFSIALATVLFSGKSTRSRWIILSAIVVCFGALTIRRNRDWADQKRLMERTLTVSPGSWKAGIHLSSISFKEGDYAAAFRYARTSATRYPYLSVPYDEIAGLYRKLGHLKKAEGYYKLALKIDPYDSRAHNGLGSIYTKAGKYGLARREFGMALRDWPHPAVLFANIGWTYELDGSLEEAGRYYRKAIERHQDYKSAYCDLGRVLYKAGKLDESRRAFKEALGIDGSYSPAHRGLGEIELERGRYRSAREHFERALSLSPGDAEVLNSIALSYKREGNLRMAFDRYGEALASDPLTGSYMDSLLDTYRMMADPSLKDELGNALMGAARRCLASGRGEMARAYLETLLQIDHGNADARRMIMELHSRQGSDY